MKITCSKEKLKDAVSKVEKISTHNPSLPILSCLLIEAHGSSLTLRATNLDVGVEVTLQCKVEEEGMVAVSSQLIKSLLSSITSDSAVFIETKDSTVIIKSDTTISTLLTQDVSDFPTIPRPEEYISFSIPIKDIVSGLKSVVYATAQTSMKPEFSSVYVYKEGVTLFFVATDSFRLAECRRTTNSHDEFEPILIPYKNTIEIIRLFDGMQDEIEVTISKSQISFTTQNSYATSRLVDSNYPDYKQIIPKEHSTQIELSKKDFETALRMSTLFSDKFNKVTFNVKPSENVVTITSSNSLIGENITTIPSKIEGEEITISFNEKYISDVMSTLSGEVLTIGLTSHRPMVIADRSDSYFMYIVMPIAS